MVSPILSNVHLHHVLDEWFENEVRPRLKGNSLLVRYADDAVLAFEHLADAQRVMAVLGKRLERYGLRLHPDKTRLIDFRSERPGNQQHPDTDGTTFNFLGFTHVWGKSRKGRNVVRQLTAKDRFARSLRKVMEWCRNNRHRPVMEQHARLSAMMRGHFAYYGMVGNNRRLQWYACQVVRIWRKWLARRGSGGKGLWAWLTAFLERHPLPAVRIVHRYVPVSEALP